MSGQAGSGSGCAGVVALAFVGFVVVILFSACSGGGSDDSDDPSGAYDDTECATLTWQVTGDGSGADDVMLEYSVHCS